MKIEVLTSPTCPYCPIAIKTVNKIAKEFPEVEVEEIDVTTPTGLAIACRHEVYAVPTIVIDDEVAFVGIPNPSDLRKAIKDRLEKGSK